MSEYGPARPKRQKAQTLLAGLTPADIDGRYLVVVRITPIMPAQDLQRAQLAQSFRQPGVDKRPLVDDDYIREAVLELEHAEQISERIDVQLLAQQSPEVAQLTQAAAVWDWKVNNPEIMAKAQKQQEAAMPGPEGLKEAMALIQKHLAGAQGLPEAMNAQPPAGQPMPPAGPGGPVPMGAPMGAGPMGPGQGAAVGGPVAALGGSAPPPMLMPSQTNMTPEQVMPNPVTLPARQARRGKAQHQRQ